MNSSKFNKFSKFFVIFAIIFSIAILAGCISPPQPDTTAGDISEPSAVSTGAEKTKAIPKIPEKEIPLGYGEESNIENVPSLPGETTEPEAPVQAGEAIASSNTTPSATGKYNPICSLYGSSQKLKYGETVTIDLLYTGFSGAPRFGTKISCGSEEIPALYKCDRIARCTLSCGPFKDGGIFTVKEIEISDGSYSARCSGELKFDVEKLLLNCQNYGLNYSDNECKCSSVKAENLCQPGQYCAQGNCLDIACPSSVVAKKGSCGNGTLELGEQCEANSDSCLGNKCGSNCNCAYTETPPVCKAGAENDSGNICTCSGKIGTEICSPGQFCHEGKCISKYC